MQFRILKNLRSCRAAPGQAVLVRRAAVFYMDTKKLITEARAKIIWGEDAESVREFGFIRFAPLR